MSPVRRSTSTVAGSCHNGEDTALIVCNGRPLAGLHNLLIMVVATDTMTVGESPSALLVDLMNGPNSLLRAVVLPGRLIVVSSTCPPTLTTTHAGPYTPAWNSRSHRTPCRTSSISSQPSGSEPSSTQTKPSNPEAIRSQKADSKSRSPFPREGVGHQPPGSP